MQGSREVPAYHDLSAAVHARASARRTPPLQRQYHRLKQQGQLNADAIGTGRQKISVAIHRTNTRHSEFFLIYHRGLRTTPGRYDFSRKFHEFVILLPDQKQKARRVVDEQRCSPSSDFETDRLASQIVDLASSSNHATLRREQTSNTVQVRIVMSRLSSLVDGVELGLFAGK